MEILTPEEIRVLGCLMEKERITPEYYPLTLNGLVNACNQKTSRDPVVDYDPVTVEDALEMLRARGLANWVHQAGSRVRKFRHSTGNILKIEDERQHAVLCILLLRGPQTLGEIRQRTERLHSFATIAEVEQVMTLLIEREEPLARELRKLPGRKERRFGHCLGTANLDGPAESSVDTVEFTPGLPSPWLAELDEREARWQETLNSLRAEIEDLKAAFDQFKKQFE